MNVPRLSLKRLFVSFTLVGVGISVAARMFWLEYQPMNRIPMERLFPLFLMSGPMIGAGLLCPFKRTVVGILIGIALQAVLWVAFVAVLFRHG